MKLQEYQVKSFFRTYGIPVPDGHVTSIAREAKQIAEEIDGPVIVKAQVLREGRSLEGGIRLAKSPEETERIASDILSLNIKGLPVSRVLIDEAIPIQEEYYVFITFDRSQRKPVLGLYNNGSIYIEAAAQALYDVIETVTIDPLIGLQRYQIAELVSRFDFPQKYVKEFITICQKLWRLFEDTDATLVGINPLAISSDNRMLALDGKITVDDYAFYRQELLFDYRQNQGEDADPLEEEAHKYGLFYFNMGGNIGTMMNGAGLSMASIDYIKSCGGRPANYLDMGGDVYEEKASKGMEILFRNPEIEIIIVNIFGGKTHCDAIAEGLLHAQPLNKRHIPIIARFSGTNEDLAREILNGSGIITANSITQAVEKAFVILGESK